MASGLKVVAAALKLPDQEDLHHSFYRRQPQCQTIRRFRVCYISAASHQPKNRSLFMFRKLTLLSFFSCAVFLTLARAQQSDAEAAIRKADIDWAKAAQTQKLDAWMAFYSDDATVLPPNEKPASSSAAIRKSIGELLTLPGLSITWGPTKVEVAKSGELGYSYGSYQDSFSGPGGKRVEDRGKYLEVWKKQKDSNWKCSIDMWSSDLPPTPVN
jgi:ketosteroid isomerase-like protein